MATPAFTEQSLGKRGSEVVSDTSAHTGDWFCLVAGPAGCTVDSITIANKINSAALEVALPAGYITYGRITSVTLSAGTAELYDL